MKLDRYFIFELAVHLNHSAPFDSSSLHEKCPYLEFFKSVFSRIWYLVSLCIQSCKKVRRRKSPNTDTFHAVAIARIPDYI